MEKRVLHQALGYAQRCCPDVSVAARYWDGSRAVYGDGPPQFTFVFADKHVVRRALQGDPIMAFGEAYLDGTFDVEGDVGDAISFLYRARNGARERGVFSSAGEGAGAGAGGLGASPLLSALAKTAGRVAGLFKGVGRPGEAAFGETGSRGEDVRHHYDVGNDFYALWLDETMSYSCAYFERPDETLEDAQRRKIDYTLRKLRLAPGERLLDIGSGWGWLIITAAQRYGVRAVGFTLSEEQYRHSRERIARLGLQDRVEVVLDDYRSLSDGRHTFDKVVSVGMFEHVGRDNHGAYMDVVSRVLKPGGLSLLHTITQPDEAPLNPWLARYIFPGGSVPSLREIVWHLPDYDFHLLDVESLRLHYALTLEAWADRFDAHGDRIGAMFDERFVRMWRLYLRSCAASFRWSGLNVHQLLFSKGLDQQTPLTRAYLYDTRP